MKANTLEVIVAAISAVALIISVRSCSKVEEFNTDSLYITTINTRIQTCTALSAFHKDMVVSEPQLTDKRKQVASPVDRAASAASLARALILCLVDYRDSSKVRQCVDEANKLPSHYVHDITTPATASAPAVGADILAC